MITDKSYIVQIPVEKYCFLYYINTVVYNSIQIKRGGFMADAKSSPAPVTYAKPLLDFSKAIARIIAGKSVTRKSWNNEKCFILLQSGFLMIKKEDGTFHTLIVSDGDMFATDWYEI
jgi:hypothetical protein